MYSLDVGEISVRVPDILSKSENEETEKVLEVCNFIIIIIVIIFFSQNVYIHFKKSIRL